LGFCVGNNVGIENALGDLIILLNNDTIVDSAWIKEILKKADDPKVGIVGCKLYHVGSKVIQAMNPSFNLLRYMKTTGRGEQDNAQFDSIEDVDYVCGASLAIKKEVITRIGLLDTKFYAYCEDVDLCYRTRKAGYKVTISNAIVYHYGSLSWNKLPLQKEYLHSRNSLYLVIKYFPPRALLRYMLFPIRSFKADLGRFLRGETVLQRVTMPSENAKLKRTLVASETVLLRTALFFVTLLVVIVGKTEPSDRNFSTNVKN
jgi:GT2 family glycosyltransferase